MVISRIHSICIIPGAGGRAQGPFLLGHLRTLEEGGGQSHQEAAHQPGDQAAGGQAHDLASTPDFDQPPGRRPTG